MVLSESFSVGLDKCEVSRLHQTILHPIQEMFINSFSILAYSNTTAKNKEIKLISDYKYYVSNQPYLVLSLEKSVFNQHFVGPVDLGPLSHIETLILEVVGRLCIGCLLLSRHWQTQWKQPLVHTSTHIQAYRNH